MNQATRTLVEPKSLSFTFFLFVYGVREMGKGGVCEFVRDEIPQNFLDLNM